MNAKTKKTTERATRPPFCNGPFFVNPSPLFLRRFTLLSVVSGCNGGPPLDGVR